MPEGNGDYPSRLDRFDEGSHRLVEMLERQTRTLEFGIEAIHALNEQAKQHEAKLEHHDMESDKNKERLDRAEILLSEMTDKINFIINREMNREGGPETRDQ